MSMPPKEIHVLGIDPGVTTGWARITVPRLSIWGSEPSKICSWKTGQLRGRISDQVWAMCEIIRETQSLAYKLGPAVVTEDFDFGRPLKDPEVYTPVYFAQQLRFCFERTALCNDARLVMQGRDIAKSSFDDARLAAAGLWAARGQTDHERDALRHALTALRRAKRSFNLRCEMWDPAHAA
ncbi:MAG TPA: hypothetical protein VN719_16135 [Gemmatimonadales bacterium]|nr:hypothetical protein [Gemmatimonadales bacterium]